MELLASTGEIYSQCTIEDSWIREDFRPAVTSVGSTPAPQKDQVNLFKTCQWTPDGSSLVTSNQDQTIRTFVVPPSVENVSDNNDSQASTELRPYSEIVFPHAVSSLAVYPRFRLTEYAGALLCASVTDHPLQLFNIHNHTKDAFSSNSNSASGVIATYPLINPNNESMPGTLALAFPSTGELVSGTTKQRGRVCLYDIGRPGQAPLHTLELAGKCRPIVSAIADGPELWAESRSLVAGYYNSPHLGGLYDFRTADSAIPFGAAEEEARSDGWKGRIEKGVTQLLWSSNGRYLFVVERRATEITVLDARTGFRRLGSLRNYKGDTNQRLTGTIVRGYKDGLNYLFLGSTDGSVTVYDEVGAVTGTDSEPMLSWTSHGQHSNISSVCVNPITENLTVDQPIMIATTGGQRIPKSAVDDDDFSIENFENSLKVWSIK